MKTLRILLAAILAVAPVASASALDRVLQSPRIKDNGDVRLSDDLKIGRMQSGKFISQPDAVQIQGTGSTGDVSSTSTAGRTLLDRARDVINPMDAPYGAKCDDVTDDTAAMQAALSAAAAGKTTLMIPAGKICKASSLDANNVIARIAGPGRLRTADGSLRGPITGIITSPPAKANTGSIVTAFSSDFSKVPLALEHRITGELTLGKPAAGYLTTPEASGIFLYSYLDSGWNQSATTNDGRTGADGVTWYGYHNGLGDLTGYSFSCYVNKTKTDAQNPLPTSACAGVAGTVEAGQDNVALQGLGDINLHANGHDVSATGSNINMFRNNSSFNSAFGHNWMAFRAQATSATYPVDAAFSAAGNFKIGLDLVDADNFMQAAVVLGQSQRFYGNAVSDGSLRFPVGIQLGTEFFHYTPNDGWGWYAGGKRVLSMTGGANGRFTAGPDQDNRGTNSVVLGANSTVTSSYGTAIGGAHSVSGANSVALGLRASDRGNIGARCGASGFFSQAGDSQSCTYTLRAASTSTSPVRLTTDGQAFSTATNCVNIPPLTTYGVAVRVTARDTAANQAWADWNLPQAVLTRDGTGTQYSGGTPTKLSAGSGSTAALSVAAETVNNCLAVDFTPPNANAWHVTATVTTTEVR